MPGIHIQAYFDNTEEKNIQNIYQNAIDILKLIVERKTRVYIYIYILYMYILLELFINLYIYIR